MVRRGLFQLTYLRFDFSVWPVSLLGLGPRPFSLEGSGWTRRGHQDCYFYRVWVQGCSRLRAQPRSSGCIRR